MLVTSNYGINRLLWITWQCLYIWYTLQGTIISHLEKRKIIFKMPFLGDMLVPWRVTHLFHFHSPHEKKWELILYSPSIHGAMSFSIGCDHIDHPPQDLPFATHLVTASCVHPHFHHLTNICMLYSFICECFTSSTVCLPPRKLTCHPKRDHFKRKIVSRPAFFRG